MTMRPMSARSGISLSQPYLPPTLQADITAAVARILGRGWLIQGEEVAAFEAALAQTLGLHDGGVVAVSSGTTALHLAMLLLNIGPGDEVIVPSYSFVATGNAVRYAGATPVFCDLIEGTPNLNVAHVEALISSKTKAVVAVHQFGVPCDIDAVLSVAKTKGLYVIEDAACALGSSLQGRPLGVLSDVACLSFHPRKVITTGEGGALVLKDPQRLERARRLRSHGLDSKQNIVELGYNYRMTEMQAALGRLQLAYLSEIVRQRQTRAAHYEKLLATRSHVKTPKLPAGTQWNVQSYWVTYDSVAQRKEAQDRLTRQGIAFRLGIPPMHQLPHFGQLHSRLPVTEATSEATLMLPCFESMTEEAQEAVVACL